MGLARRLSALGLLLLRALLVCTQSQDQESVFAIVGEDFTFSPKVNGTIKEITWMKRKDKVAEWEGGVESPTYYSSLAERGKLETSSGNFTIKKLNAGDAAEYEAQVLPGNDGPLQYTKFILEVLDPPPPSVLNCSVTNGQIRISCAIQFSKDVHYSWYRNDRKIDANSPVLELKENADPSGKVLCIREVSKTKINDSISLSACFPESDKSISRGRDGLIAIFVILLLLLFMGALFVLWKRGLRSSILHRIPTKHSAVYKPEEQHLTDDERFPEESGQTEGEAAKSMQVGEDVRVNLQDSNESQTEKDEEKSSKESESMNQPDPPSNEENPDSENISDRNQEPDEDKSSKETESMNKPDAPSNEENPDSENISSRNQKPEEKKNSKETESMNKPDLPSNEENPDSENISSRNQKPDEEKSSKETESMNQPDAPSNEENPDSENISDRNQEPDEDKSSKETESMNKPDAPSNEENPDSENISSRNQKPDLKLQSEAD